MFFGAKNHLLSYQPFQFNLYKSPARGYAKRPEVFKISRQRKKILRRGISSALTTHE